MSIGNLAKLNRSTRNSIFAALVVIAAIAMYSWIVTPHVAYLSAAQQYDSAMDTFVDASQTIARKLNGRRKELDKLREQFTQCRSALFTPDEDKEFFGNLQSILEETGCVVNSLNLVVSQQHPSDKRPEDTTGMVANSTKFSVIGRYNSIIKLAGKLQNNTKKVWVDSFKMEIFDFSSAQLKCDMTITIYTIQDKEAAL